MTGYPVVNVKYVLQDGATHVVDSSSNAFMIATRYSFAQAFPLASPMILEPTMIIEVTVPNTAYVIFFLKKIHYFFLKFHVFFFIIFFFKF